MRLGEEDLYLIEGPLNPGRLMALYEGDHSPELRDPPFVAPVTESLRNRPDLFAAIRERDTVLRGDARRERGQVGVRDAIRGGLPQRCVHESLALTGVGSGAVSAAPRSARNGSGSGIGRVVFMSIQTSFAAPSAYCFPSIQIS